MSQHVLMAYMNNNLFSNFRKEAFVILCWQKTKMVLEKKILYARVNTVKIQLNLINCVFTKTNVLAYSNDYEFQLIWIIGVGSSTQRPYFQNGQNLNQHKGLTFKIDKIKVFVSPIF